MTVDIRKQTVLHTLGNVVYLASLWGMTVLTTRALGYESVGRLTLAMSVGNVFTFIQFYGVRAFQSSDAARQYTSGDYLRARGITAAAGLILCLAFLLFSGYAPSLAVSVCLYTLFRTFETVSDVFFGDIQRSGRTELVGITMLIRGLLTVLLFWLGLRCFRDLNGALGLAALGSLTLTAVPDVFLYRRFALLGKGSGAGCRGVLRDCFPLLLASLLPTIITAFPRLLLERFNGPELLGFYGNVSTPAVIITAVVPNILAALMPRYGELAAAGDVRGIRRLWGKTLLGTLGILAVCLLGALLLARPVLAWFYTDAILPYVHYLYPFLLSTALYAATMCTGSALVALRRNRWISLCALAATALCVGISFPLVRSYAITGAILSLIAAYLLQLLLQCTVLCRNTGGKKEDKP